jgi:hypothetical protein
MRLRDVPKYWCPFCWAMVSLFTVLWAGCVVLLVIGFAAGVMALAALAGLFAALIGSVTVWAGYFEALNHYKDFNTLGLIRRCQ